MKTIFTAYLLLLFIGIAVSQESKQKKSENRIVVTDCLQEAFSSHITGFVGEKLSLSCQNRILAQDVDRLVSPFRRRTETTCWQSEFWGKWFTSAILAYRYQPTPQLKDKIDRAVDELVATQTSDGYIGNYAENSHLEAWDIWGRKYCMLGLLAYYDLIQKQKPLIAARGIADHLIKELAESNIPIVKKGNQHGMAATSVIEPICLLYSRTGETRYLNFANEIVRQWETPDGPQLISKANVNVAKRFPKPSDIWFGWEQGQKAYEMMSCYEGLLELYRLTGEEEYKEAVEKTWQNICNDEINIVGSGSALECWFSGKQFQNLPILHYQETCVTVTWIKLCQQLLRLTGEAKYADAIEQSYYNALLGAMKPDGADWNKYTPLSGQRMGGGEQCGMGINCCVANGPRGLFTIPFTALMLWKNGLQINFFVSGKYSLQTPQKQKIDVMQETTYPVAGEVRIKIQLQKPETMTFRIRIPEWSKESSLKVNGLPFKAIVSGEYVSIQRQWEMDDVIDLTLDMRTRVVKMGKNPECLAIIRGPVVLARDARLTGPELESIIKPDVNKEGYLNVEQVMQKDTDIWMEFKASFIPESYSAVFGQPIIVHLCDYSSAGNTNKGHPFFKVWLPQLLDPRKMKE